MAREVVDQMGRRMQIVDTPRRVISLAPSITEIISALKQQQYLVGVTLFSEGGYPFSSRNRPDIIALK